MPRPLTGPIVHLRKDMNGLCYFYYGRAMSKRRQPKTSVPTSKKPKFTLPPLNENGELDDPKALFQARVACPSAYAKFRHKEDLAEAILLLVDNGSVPWQVIFPSPCLV